MRSLPLALALPVPAGTGRPCPPAPRRAQAGTRMRTYKGGTGDFLKVLDFLGGSVDRQEFTGWCLVVTMVMQVVALVFLVLALRG